MDTDTLPIGSIIKVSGKNFMTVGYQTMREEDHIKTGYYTVPFPMGFIDSESLGFCKDESIERVVFRGADYKRNEGFLERYDKFRDSVKKCRCR
jgi:hypothetical protein